MKKLILSIIALCCTAVAGAQNSSQQISAILQTGDVTTVYYGADALKNAYNAAENGSVITLTSGSFNSPGNIQKSISIYGVGFEDNLIPGLQKTTISGAISFLADASGNFLQNPKLEGVFVNNNINVRQVEGLTIAKCQFGDLIFNGTGTTGMLVRQCYLTGSLYARNNYVIGGLTVKNCYFAGWIYDITADSRVLVDHCIFVDERYSHANYPATYTNCIIQHSWGDNDTVTGLRYGSYAQNCVFARGPFSANVISENNWFSVDFSTLFSDANNSAYTVDRTFTLPDNTQFIGTDGTPVGVAGGDYPWYKQPGIPYVKDLNATVNGTNLGVTYEAGVRSANPPTE